MTDTIVLLQIGDVVTLECASSDLEECYAQPPRKPVIRKIESFKVKLSSERENECIDDLI